MYVLSTSTSLLPVLTELRSLPPRTQAMFAVCDHVCDVCAVHLYISAPRVLTELRSLPPRAQVMFAVCDHVCDVCAVHLYISAPTPVKKVSVQSRCGLQSFMRVFI